MIRNAQVRSKVRSVRAKHQVFSQLRDSATWSAARLQELQWTKLQQLLCHAYDSCELYHDRMEQVRFDPRRDFRQLDCLDKLPLLQKSDIQKHYQKLLARDAHERGVQPNATGGSTGMPINFFQDANYRMWADAARTRAWRWIDGISPYGVEAVLWGSERDVGRGFSITRALKGVLRYRSFALNTFDLDAKAIRKFFRFYHGVRPQILRGYASSLYFVANFVASEGIRVRSPKVIISSAETLWPAMRQRISDVFGADVIDSYGCREVSQIATECCCHTGLHIVMENQYVEIVDGQVIVTNLNNFAMPFIRYQVGDLAESINTCPCRCGREAHRLIGLKGRDNDNITLPNGKVINGEFFEFLFFGFKSVERFQVIYSRADQLLLVRLKVTDRSERLDEIVARRMNDGFGFDNVRVEFTDTFATSSSGKFRFVHSVDDFDSVHVG